MKKGKPEKKVELKNFTQPKDIIPDKLAPSLKVREPRVPKPAEPTNPDTLEKNRFVQDPLFEEWPSEDALAQFDFGLTTDKPFKDTVQVPLPPSFSKESNEPVIFSRYKDYLASFLEKSQSLQNTIKDQELGGDRPSSSSSAKRMRQSNTQDLEALRMDISDFQSSIL